jgi:hypothetical protein
VCDCPSVVSPERPEQTDESSLGAAGRSLVAATTRRLLLAGRSGKETVAAWREGETRRANMEGKSTEAFTYACLSESPWLLYLQLTYMGLAPLTSKA